MDRKLKFLIMKYYSIYGNPSRPRHNFKKTETQLEVKQANSEICSEVDPTFNNSLALFSSRSQMYNRYVDILLH